MGSGLVGPVLPVLLVLLVVIGLVVVLFRWQAEQRQEQDLVLADRNELLEFRVPEGQDPAAVTHALSSAGFRVAREGSTGAELVAVRARDSEREQVRDLISSAPLNLGGDRDASLGRRDVHFEDETT